MGYLGLRNTFDVYSDMILKVKVPPIQATKALRAGRGIALPNF